MKSPSCFEQNLFAASLAPADLATHLPLLITQLLVMTCIKLSSPASLDICLMPFSMLHHCFYFLTGVNRIYYSVCTQWLLVLICYASAQGHPEGARQCFLGGLRSLGCLVPRIPCRQCMYMPLCVCRHRIHHLRACGARALHPSTQGCGC